MLSRWCRDSLAYGLTFPDNRGGFDIPRFPLVYELLPVNVQDICPRSPELLRDEETFGLLREHDPGRVVLHRVEEAQVHPCPVSYYQTIRRGPIVIRRHKPLIMEPSRPSRGHDNRLRLDTKIFLRFKVIENRASAVTVLVQDQLHSRGEFQELDIPDPTSGLVPDGPHDFGPSDVRGVVHPLPTRASPV